MLLISKYYPHLEREFLSKWICLLLINIFAPPDNTGGFFIIKLTHR